MDTQHYRMVERDFDVAYWSNCQNCAQTVTTLGESEARHSPYDYPVQEFKVITSKTTDQ